MSFVYLIYMSFCLISVCATRSKLISPTVPLREQWAMLSFGFCSVGLEATGRFTGTGRAQHTNLLP